MFEIIDINDFSKAEYEYFFSLMENERREKINRFRFDEDKKRSVFGEMLAKKMIAKHFDKTYEEVIIKADETGKLYAENLDIHFNISHSGEFVICALSDKQIGVDIEKIRDIKDNLINHVCTKDEKDYIIKNENEKNKRFIEIWTAKEAYFKYLGTGITDLKSINTLDDEFISHLNRLFYKDYCISIYS